MEQPSTRKTSPLTGWSTVIIASPQDIEALCEIFEVNEDVTPEVIDIEDFRNYNT